MRRCAVLFVVLILLVSAGVLLVYEPPAARGQAYAGPSSGDMPPPGVGEPPVAPPRDGKEYLGTRYRVLVIQSTSRPGNAGAVPLLSHLTSEVGGAVAALGKRPAAEGMFATIPYPNDFAGAIEKGEGKPEIIFVGEGETMVGGKCSIRTGTRFPVQSVQMRGTSQTITTQFEKIGMKVDIVPRGGMDEEPLRPGVSHQVSMEFSALSAFGKYGAPVISEFSSQGDIILPDAHMAVFHFLDRVKTETLGVNFDGQDGAAGGAGGKGGGTVAGDTVTLYFLCLIRMDMGR